MKRYQIAAFFRYGIPATLKRYRLALAYARGRQTEDQAFQMLYDCQQTAGSHCLISIDASDVLEGARTRWADNPELDRLARDAAARVASKWSDSSEIRSSAEDWAVDLVAEYAESEGIKLIELTELEDA